MHLLPAPKFCLATTTGPFIKAMQRSALPLLLASAALGTATPVLALPSDSNQTITLEADRATYNEKTGITTYTGNVIIQQGTIKIQADSLVATLNKNRQIQQVTAKGLSLIHI